MTLEDNPNKSQVSKTYCEISFLQSIRQNGLRSVLPQDDRKTLWQVLQPGIPVLEPGGQGRVTANFRFTGSKIFVSYTLLRSINVC